ncbi:MAG: lactate racemase domain-containing protein [Eubacteriales bacterium]|nr:lactate racemase domain-containing protein [Eubacteriales bacterium]
MSKLAELVSFIRIPRMIEVRQKFPRPQVGQAEEELNRQLKAAGVGSRIHPGDRVAITAGSRGIDHIVEVTRGTVRFVREQGGIPFIIPAMGSHGGATAEGQEEILASLGITEESCGCPVQSSMETVCIGHAGEERLPVYVDKLALEADGIILINRIKPHPSFQGPIESGLMKMAVIGLGKQKGAALCHSLGMVHMSENIQKIGQYILDHTHVLFGIGLIENAYDETAEIHVIKAEEIRSREEPLLKKAYENFPRIAIPRYDVLLVEETGKNISGAGLDTMIISRYTHDGIPKDPHQQMICALRLTEETHGNACGMGLIDVVPEKYRDAIDFMNTYPNLITSRIYNSAKMPMVVDNDKVAVQTAINGCMGIDYDNPKLIWMKNTLDIGRIFVSEALWGEIPEYPELEIVGEPFEMRFRENGDLVRIDEMG